MNTSEEEYEQVKINAYKWMLVVIGEGECVQVKMSGASEGECIQVKMSKYKWGTVRKIKDKYVNAKESAYKWRWIRRSDGE